jgi:hypothetical protein
MLFHTSPRCNNGMHIHILSERFALYYTLFSDAVLRLKSVIRESRYSHAMRNEVEGDVSSLHPARKPADLIHFIKSVGKVACCPGRKNARTCQVLLVGLAGEVDPGRPLPNALPHLLGGSSLDPDAF